jgi:hypothetical protein
MISLRDILREYDASTQKAGPRPSRGTGRRERRERKTKAEAHLDDQKAIAKKRDEYKCRWPGCKCSKGRYKPLLESAHIVDKSLGGSDETENLMTICDNRHRGTPSLHSKDLKIEKLSDKGANGLLSFYAKNQETGEWEHVFTEKYIAVSTTKGD